MATAPIFDKDNALADWLAVLHAPSVGPVTFSRLLKQFTHPQNLLAAGRAQWQAAGLKPQLINYLAEPDWETVARDLQWLAQPDNHLLTWDDPDYPQTLLDIHDPPPVLFVRGQLAALKLPQIAIVGSRHPTRGGEETAFSFAQHFAEAGLGVSSGLASGIDSAAHRGALKGGGLTIAVAGTGADRVYPAKNKELAKQIIEQGAVVTEFPPGTPLQRQNFPRRNRIISGLSTGTLVVEASLRSGSLITARQAAEQGREVFAIPGSIHNPLARGCHALIKEGCKLVETVEDILEELALPVLQIAQQQAQHTEKHAPQVPDKQSVTATKTPVIDGEYGILLNQMGIEEPVSVDSLVARCGLTAEAISSMLLILELQGHVAIQAGGQYVRLNSKD